MKRLLKYELGVHTTQILHIDKEAKVLSVISQRGHIIVYVIANEAAEHGDLEFVLLGTGNERIEVPGDTFLGTIPLHDGNLMVHIFYRWLV